MISVEREEGRQLHPAIAELFIGIAIEAAGVDAKHGNAKEREGEGLGNGKHHVHE